MFLSNSINTFLYLNHLYWVSRVKNNHKNLFEVKKVEFFFFFTLSQNGKSCQTFSNVQPFLLNFFSSMSICSKFFFLPFVLEVKLYASINIHVSLSLSQTHTHTQTHTQTRTHANAHAQVNSRHRGENGKACWVIFFNLYVKVPP